MCRPPPPATEEIWANKTIGTVECIQPYNPKSVEDCLFLDVTAPTAVKAGGWPVMVWVHGGGLQFGSKLGFSGQDWAGKEWLDSTADADLAAEGLLDTKVVVVAINYRLGLLGYMRGPGVPESAGSVMVGDMVNALKWVQQNIEAFGGDKNRVTLFGESGGGLATQLVRSSPAAVGLVHRVISQSPQAPPPVIQNNEYPAGTAVVNTLCAGASDTLACLQGKTVAQLQAAADAAVATGLSQHGTPVDDGTIVSPKFTAAYCGGANPDSILNPAGPGKVPLLTGNTAEEMAYFNIQKGITPESDLESGGTIWPGMKNVLSKSKCEKYPKQAVSALSSLLTKSGSTAQHFDSDLNFPLAILLGAGYPGTADNVYRYVFNVASDAYSKQCQPVAAHTCELPFFFAGMAVDATPLPKTPGEFTNNFWKDPAHLAAQKTLRRLWLRFALKGELGPVRPGKEVWPKKKWVKINSDGLEKIEGEYHSDARPGT